jgi:hypothetical protein
VKESVKLTGWPAALAGLCGLAAIAHAPVLFVGGTFIDRDYLSLVVPLRSFLAEALRAGRWPEWCDALGFGAPFLSNPQNQVLYPPAWLVAVLPLGFASDLIVLLHLVWAGMGMRAFALRLGAEPGGAFLAGGVFLLGGYTSSMVGMGTPLTTLAWLPWMAAAADRLALAEGVRERARATAWTAAAAAGAFLAGDPAGVVTAALLCAGVVLVRAPDRARRGRGVLSLLAAALLAAALTGVLLVPAILELREAERGGGISVREAMLWSTHPARLLELVIPRAFGDQTNTTRTLARVFADAGDGSDLDTTWASSVYLGLPVVVLAIAGIRREGGARGLALVSLVFVALALGKNTPLYGLYRQVALFEQFLRYPERHLAGAMVLWTALAGLGFRRIFSAAPSRRVTLALAGGALGLALVVVLEHVLASRAIAFFDGLAQAQKRELATERALAAAQAGAISALVVTALVAALVAAHRWLPVTAPWTPAATAAAILIGLAVEARAVLPLVDRALVSGLPELLEPLLYTPRDHPGDKGLRPRIYRDRWIPIPAGAEPDAYARVTHECANENRAIPFGFAHVPGYQPGRTASARIGRFFRKVPIIVDAFDVRYLIMPEERLPPGPKKVVNTIPPMAVVESQRVRPRGYVAPRWSWWPDDDAALEGLFPEAIKDVGAVRLIGSGPSSGSDRVDQPPARCGVEMSRPEDVLVRCDSAMGGHVVLLDEWAPGWTAEVDGRPAPVYRADALFRAVPVPAGPHEVRFRYRTPGLGAGTFASVLGVLCLAALGLLPAIGRRGRDEAPGTTGDFPPPR